MNGLEVFNAWASRDKLQVNVDLGVWVNCVIKDIRMGITDIVEVELMVLDPEGWPTDLPIQLLSQKNFYKLRKKQA